MPTVREIAEFAGVSISTVSLVLNDKPGVSDEMRRHVLESASHLEVRQAAWPSGNSLYPNAGQKPLSVVLLHPTILRSSQVFHELLQGIQAGADLYQIQLRLAANEPNLPPDHVTSFYFSDPALRPQGLLIIGARLEEPLVEAARELGILCVFVGRQSTAPDVSAVGRNESAIAYQVTEKLLDLGHRAIAFVGGDWDYSYTRSRLKGYRQALADRGINLLDRWTALGAGAEAAAKIIENSPEITAAIFVNDANAVKGLPLFQAAGYSIPGDLSVISFDDTEEARTFDPPLSSVSYPRHQEGFWSVKVLVERLRQPLMQSCRVVFRASLVERDSCTHPREEAQARVYSSKGGDGR
jgi:LacI family transcriptional regulator